jgi:allantoicase
VLSCSDDFFASKDNLIKPSVRRPNVRDAADPPALVIYERTLWSQWCAVRRMGVAKTQPDF